MSAIINGLDRPENSHRIDYIRIVTTSASYDITQLLVAMNLFEDLREDSVDGEIFIIDENNIISTMPIIGREKIQIKFAGRSNAGEWLEPYIKEFDILNADNATRGKFNKTDLVKINFTSTPYYKNRQCRVSKSYNEVTNDKVVEDLMSILGHTIETEPCLYPRLQVVPNMNPFDWINFLTGESTSKENLSSDYAFFENADGYHFKSLYTLAQQDAEFTLNYGLDNANSYDRFTIKDYKNDMPFNILEQIEGALGSTISTHDLTRKKIITGETDYYSYQDEFSSMNSGSLYVDDTQEQFIDSKITYDVADSFYDTNDETNINQRLKRDMNKVLLESSPSTVYLPGSNDIKIGQTINFELLVRGEADVFRSGKFLVSKIKHELAPTSYTMVLEIVKDSNIVTRKNL